MDDIEYHMYRVLMRPEEGPSWWTIVPRAMGPRDAENQARQAAFDDGEDASPIKWEVVQ
jgi:hypothetical protein